MFEQIAPDVIDGYVAVWAERYFGGSMARCEGALVVAKIADEETAARA